MIPPSAQFAIREAVALLRASRRNFKSRQVEQARALLEKLLELEGIPLQPERPHAEKADADRQKTGHQEKTHCHHD